VLQKRPHHARPAPIDLFLDSTQHCHLAITRVDHVNLRQGLNHTIDDVAEPDNYLRATRSLNPTDAYYES